MKVKEPVVNADNYKSSLTAALNWYSQEKEKKDAKEFLRDYISLHFTKQDVVTFNRLPDYKVINTYGWVSRMVLNETLKLEESDSKKFNTYLLDILDTSDIPLVVEEEKEEKLFKPSVRDNMVEKVKEYLGELEGSLDEFIKDGKELTLYTDLKSRAIPQPYCPFIDEWIKNTAGEYIYVYESTDEEVKEGYSNISKRKLTQIIKMFGSWTEDLDRYTLFKKANRKPRVKKAKAPGIQVAKLNFKREDIDLGIKSVLASEIVGASQVWVYNTKNKKLAVYRTESTSGIQVKGTTLQNYESDLSEQKTLRKPKETLKAVLSAGKVQLRRIIPELTTKESPLNGRINAECLIVRVLK